MKLNLSADGHYRFTNFAWSDESTLKTLVKYQITLVLTQVFSVDVQPRET